MGSVRKIVIGVLTSSRADFGIYLPLLNEIKKDDSTFELKLIVFGTHLSKYHGHTKTEILASGFHIDYEIPGLLLTDDKESIATSFSIVSNKFAAFWSNYKEVFDYVLCLGDRFEMAAAVASGIPFNLRFVHFHGGETTLGAIDNIYRHFITLASTIHLVSTDQFKKRVTEITGSDGRNCFVVGSLSLANLRDAKILKPLEFKQKWNIDLIEKFILVTVHPETVAAEKNLQFADELFKILEYLSKEWQIVITMPNADTDGTLFREMFHRLKNQHSNKIHLIENFGTVSYFTCLKYADFLLGNTSSGIIEAASFGKYVINLGDRQKGRLAGENVLTIPFNFDKVIEGVKKISGKEYSGENIYYKENSPQQVIQILKSLI